MSPGPVPQLWFCESRPSSIYSCRFVSPGPVPQLWFCESRPSSTGESSSGSAGLGLVPATPSLRTAREEYEEPCRQKQMTQGNQTTTTRPQKPYFCNQKCATRPAQAKQSLVWLHQSQRFGSGSVGLDPVPQVHFCESGYSSCDTQSAGTQREQQPDLCTQT